MLKNFQFFHACQLWHGAEDKGDGGDDHHGYGKECAYLRTEKKNLIYNITKRTKFLGILKLFTTFFI
jgi:hypothetical protein